MQISALILTKDEQDIIEDCLKQLGFVDEIIVLDQKSQDKTREIVNKYTSKILTTNFWQFDKNRNILAKEAKGDWLLYLDSDEKPTASLIDEIEKTIKDDKFSAYYIPRENFVLNMRVRHGGWWPDYAPRLFKKKDLVGWYGKIHESPKIRGKFGYLHQPLIHNTARSLNLMLKKSIKWAKIEATLYYESGNPKVNILKAIKATSSEFIYRYFLKLGVFDGTIGLIEALYQSLHKAIIFTYLWEMQNRTLDKFKKEKIRLQ